MQDLSLQDKQAQEMSETASCTAGIWSKNADVANVAHELQEARQQVKRQRQSAVDDKAAVARQQRRERDRDIERARDRIKRERDNFNGCYAPVLEAMLQPLPKQACFDLPCVHGQT